MRSAKKKVVKKKVIEKPKVSSSAVNNRLVHTADVAEKAALLAQSSLEETTKLVKKLVESIEDNDQLVIALTKVLEERRNLPFRAIPVRGEDGRAKFFDFVALEKITH